MFSWRKFQSSLSLLGEEAEEQVDKVLHMFVELQSAAVELKILLVNVEEVLEDGIDQLQDGIDHLLLVQAFIV